MNWRTAENEGKGRLRFFKRKEGDDSVGRGVEEKPRSYQLCWKEGGRKSGKAWPPILIPPILLSRSNYLNILFTTSDTLMLLRSPSPHPRLYGGFREVVVVRHRPLAQVVVVVVVVASLLFPSVPLRAHLAAVALGPWPRSQYGH